MARLWSLLLVACLPGCLGLELSGGAQSWESAGPFVGDWQNVDPATRGTVRLQIWTDEESILVNPWGACTPNPCNNGRFRLDPAEADDGVLSYSRKLSFKIETGEASS